MVVSLSKAIIRKVTLYVLAILGLVVSAYGILIMDFSWIGSGMTIVGLGLIIYGLTSIAQPKVIGTCYIIIGVISLIVSIVNTMFRVEESKTPHMIVLAVSLALILVGMMLHIKRAALNDK